MDRVSDGWIGCETREVRDAQDEHTQECTQVQPGFRVQGAGFRVQGSGFRVQDSGCRIQGAGFTVHGSRCWVQGPCDRLQKSEVPKDASCVCSREDDLCEKVARSNPIRANPWYTARRSKPLPGLEAGSVGVEATPPTGRPAARQCPIQTRYENSTTKRTRLYARSSTRNVFDQKRLR